MAIILVNTILGAAPPETSVPMLPEGVPLDFEFYAARRYPSMSAREAIKKALSDFRKLDSRTEGESVVASESVVSENLLTNPSLYVGGTSIDPHERIPKEWLPVVSQRQSLIQRVLQSVGRIQVLHYTPERMHAYGYEVGIALGSGFVVAPSIVMTNRHVAELFAQAKSSTSARRT
jgi:hypothetical protein